MSHVKAREQLKAIRKAPDAELLQLFREFKKFVGQANRALRVNARGMAMNYQQKNAAAEQIQSYRESFYIMLKAEVERRGLDAEV